jgi:hypothetical protein
MMHGYDTEGTVYGTYEVNVDTKMAVIKNDGRDFARAFWSYLYETRNRIKNFYDTTETEPLKFAGEWNRLLYKDNSGILSVDIELPGSFDEGRRGEINWRKYNANKVEKEFNGILANGRGNYYELLENYSSIIDKYKEQHPIGGVD